MPRVARVKVIDKPYHIMVRSIKEIDLFKENEDKIKYFQLIRKAQLKYGFKIYAYCLMNNHGHLILDPAGADVSKIMHLINFTYARYYNRKYDRYGHVFQDRFKSKIIDTDRYIITLSAYIHNNPKDIKDYETNVEKYPFSSFIDYLEGINRFGILSCGYLESLIGFKNKLNKYKYTILVKSSTDEGLANHVEFERDKTLYLSYKLPVVKYRKPREVILYVASLLKLSPQNVHIKYKRSATKIRALSSFLMSSICGISQREICKIIGEISQSGVSYLAAKGASIIENDRSILDNLLDI